MMRMFAGILAIAAMGWPWQHAIAAGRIYCSTAGSGSDPIIGVYDGPNGQLIGHATKGTLLGKALTDLQLPKGSEFFSADWVGLSKSYGHHDGIL